MAGMVLDLKFPVAGVSRRRGFGLASEKGAYPTPWAVNVRPEDPISSRLRGGSRPGLTAFSSSSAPQWPVSDLESESSGSITAEDGQTILMPSSGSPVFWPDLLKAIEAYGYGSIPESIGASVGTLPTGNIACGYRDRLVIAGGSIVYLSRQGNYTDWNYGGSVNDGQRAVLFQLSEASERGDTVTALIPHRDAHLLAATERGLWVIQGDPATSGSLAAVSRDVGIISGRAWAKSGDAIFFLSPDGLFTVSASGGGLKNLSGDRLPDELSDIDTTAVTVNLGYHPGHDGVYIFLKGADYHWYFDLEHAGFWPFTIPSHIDPTTVFNVDGELVLWDGSTGFWSVGGDDDDGTAIESHVVLGPFRPGSASQYGLLSSLHAAVETESDGTVEWGIVVGETAEEACENAKAAVEAYMSGDTDTAASYVKSSGSWASGRSRVFSPRVRAMWITIWLRSTSKWACENIVAEFGKFGSWR